MKKLIPFAILSVLIFAASCGLKEQKKIDMTQVAQIEDSILQAQIVPSTTAIHIYQDNDFNNAYIIIKNDDLYKGKDNSKIQQAAVRTGVMLCHVLGPDMTVSKASLVISINDRNEDKVPDDGITADMKIDSLKKVLFPAK